MQERVRLDHRIRMVKELKKSSIYILEEKPAIALENILEYESAPDRLYSQHSRRIQDNQQAHIGAPRELHNHVNQQRLALLGPLRTPPASGCRSTRRRRPYQC